MEHILITYGTRPLAQRLSRLLASPERMVFGSWESTPQLMLDTGKYVVLPRGDSPSFSHEILTICLDLGVGIVIPLGKSEVQLLSSAKQLFAEYGIHVLVPSAAELTEVAAMENPPAHVAIDIVLDGISLLGLSEGTNPDFSGVMALDVEGAHPTICYIPD